MDNKNFIVFITLSVALLLVWNEFYTKPRMEAEQARQAAQEQLATDVNALPNPGEAAVTSTARPSLDGGESVVTLTRDQALGTNRVVIDSPSLKGSINLKGARVDDITLKKYRETVDPTSAQVILFSPERAPNAYFADFGWAPSPTDPTLKVPNKDSLWKQTTPGPLTVSTPVELTWNNGAGLTFRRKISLDENYMFTITQIVENNSQKTVELFPYGRISRYGKPEGQNFFILHEGFLGVYEGELVERKYDKVLKEGALKRTSTGGWLGITDKYWLAALAPDQSRNFEGTYASRKVSGVDRFNASFLMDGVAVLPGGRTETTSNFFVGAKLNSLLTSYQKNLGIEKFDLAIDWGWFFFITKPIFSLLHYFGHLIGNFGIAILIVTIIVKAILFPLANKSYESMAKMKKLQPEMLSLRERFAEDKVKQQQEIMELYRREKVNPLAGCLPMLIQIPVFFALYKVLFVTIEMRQAPFFGWIHDLAAQDPTSILNLFGLLPYDPSGIPLIGTALGIGVWPLLMGITMFVQMRMNPAPQDPIQEKMFALMPIIFTFMLARFPSGLVIYWAWNNSLTIIQQYVIMRRNDVEVELVKNLKLDRFFKPKEPITVAAGAEGQAEPAKAHEPQQVEAEGDTDQTSDQASDQTDAADTTPEKEDKS